MQYSLLKCLEYLEDSYIIWRYALREKFCYLFTVPQDINILSV